jgi:predicted nucleic acid-binding protein
VKSFVDTSVLVSAFHVEHPHHQPSFELFIRCNKNDACCGLHSLGVVYDILTGMRVPARRASGARRRTFGFVSLCFRNLRLASCGYSGHWSR